MTSRRKKTGEMSFVNAIISTQGLRHQNRAIVLNAIREFGPLAHTDIGEKTGLASGTVSVITTEFTQEGVLEKVERPPAKGRGRPRILFATKADFARIVLVRISAEKVQFSLVDYSSTLLDRQIATRDPAQESAAQFGVAIEQWLLNFLSRSNLSPRDVRVLSITTKGEIDETNGTLLWSPIFGNQRLDFKALFAPRWRAEVSLTNEISFFAHHVMQKSQRSGLARAGDRHAVLSLSDNIGLGVATLNDQGEITLSSPAFGHIPHNTDGPLCRCGASGCLESYAGFYGILRTAFDAPKDKIPAKFIPLEQMQNLAANARAGDRMTEFAFRQAGAALGVCLSRMFNILGPMPLTIIGAGLAFYDLLEVGLKEQLSDSFLVRMGQVPQLDLVHDETEQSFDSNVFVSLRNFDRTQVATRRYKNAS